MGPTLSLAGKDGQEERQALLALREQLREGGTLAVSRTLESPESMGGGVVLEIVTKAGVTVAAEFLVHVARKLWERYRGVVITLTAEGGKRTVLTRSDLEALSPAGRKALLAQLAAALEGPAGTPPEPPSPRKG